MALEETKEKDEIQIRRRIQVATAAFVFVSSLMREFGTNAAVAWIGCGTLAILLAYWFRPRPRETFLRWTLILETYLLGMVVIGYLIPLRLKTVLPKPIAFDVPIFLVSFAFYFMPANPIYRKQSRLGRWTLGCVAVAAVFGLMSTVLRTDS
jgi:hypothetical protein